jgi:hypothetical protein
MNASGTLGLVAALLFGVILLFCGRRLRRVGCVVASLAISFLAFFVYQIERLHTGDARIQIGASKVDVLAAQGRPTASTDCSTSYGYERTSLSAPGCTQILWYYSFLTPEAWEYVFDANGRLIHKYHWQSP